MCGKHLWPWLAQLPWPRKLASSRKTWLLLLLHWRLQQFPPCSALHTPPTTLSHVYCGKPKHHPLIHCQI